MACMKVALAILTLVVAASSANADPWARLRNASANELCWDKRGFAREKYPTVRVEDSAPAFVSLKPPARHAPFSESRKKFAGIRDC